MATVSFRIDDAIDARITKLASLTGRTKTYYLTQAITQNLDHLEKVYLAEQRLTDIRSNRASTDAQKEETA